MTITSIAATAGRTFNHPHEQFANFRFELHFTAQLEDGEDAGQALALLKARTEAEADAHKAAILADIERKRRIAVVAQELEFERRKAFDHEAGKARVAKLEAELTQLTSSPLALAVPTLHAGHADHPDTENLSDAEAWSGH
jgi:hypothetical protein